MCLCMLEVFLFLYFVCCFLLHRALFAPANANATLRQEPFVLSLSLSAKQTFSVTAQGSVLTTTIFQFAHSIFLLLLRAVTSAHARCVYMGSSHTHRAEEDEEKYILNWHAQTGFEYISSHLKLLSINVMATLSSRHIWLCGRTASASRLAERMDIKMVGWKFYQSAVNIQSRIVHENVEKQSNGEQRCGDDAVSCARSRLSLYGRQPKM